MACAATHPCPHPCAAPQDPFQGRPIETEIIAESISCHCHCPQVALVDQLLDEVWSGPWAVVLNPTWFEGLPGQYTALVDSWEAAYSLTITATQGLMRTEGAVLRTLAPGSSASSSSPWRVLLKDKRSDHFVQVGLDQEEPPPVLNTEVHTRSHRQIMHSMLAVQWLVTAACAMHNPGPNSPAQRVTQHIHLDRGSAYTQPIAHHHQAPTVPCRPPPSPPPQVGQMQRRPTGSDLELAFINAKAAQSPLTSLVKGVRGIFDKQQQHQQQ